MWEVSLIVEELALEPGEFAQAKSINVIPMIMSLFTMILFTKKTGCGNPHPLLISR
jgi:hypothetical protein